MHQLAQQQDLGRVEGFGSTIAFYGRCGSGCLQKMGHEGENAQILEPVTGIAFEQFEGGADEFF